MKPTVMTSYEDDSGQRCVDILKHSDGTWSWVECRRDPEDATGWRTLDGGSERYADETVAVDSARMSVEWLGETREG